MSESTNQLPGATSKGRLTPRNTQRLGAILSVTGPSWTGNKRVAKGLVLYGNLVTQMSLKRRVSRLSIPHQCIPRGCTKWQRNRSATRATADHTITCPTNESAGFSAEAIRCRVANRRLGFEKATVGNAIEALRGLLWPSFSHVCIFRHVYGTGRDSTRCAAEDFRRSIVRFLKRKTRMKTKLKPSCSFVVEAFL
jgi:hypothetical protein